MCVTRLFELTPFSSSNFADLTESGIGVLLFDPVAVLVHEKEVGAHGALGGVGVLLGLLAALGLAALGLAGLPLLGGLVGNDGLCNFVPQCVSSQADVAHRDTIDVHLPSIRRLVGFLSREGLVDMISKFEWWLLMKLWNSSPSEDPRARNRPVLETGK